MYIQVTTKCQMSCLHCLYSCTMRGDHMGMDVFRAAVNASMAYDSMIAIGGGEPTLHPDIEALLGIASFLSAEPVFMVTNGTCEYDVWRRLMRACEVGNLDLHVSRDYWHDMGLVRPWVEDEAERSGLWWGDEFRSTIERSGRAARNWDRIVRECEMSGIELREDKDGCGLPRISPDGRVWADIPGRRRRSCGHVTDDAAIEKAFEAVRRHEERNWA